MTSTAHDVERTSTLTIQTPKTGDRVRMIGLMDDPTPLPIGSEGTVRIARPDAGQIDVDWDNGSRLILLIEDPFEIIPNR